MTSRRMTAITINLRPDFCGASSCTAVVVAVVGVSVCSNCSAKLLSSEIVFVVGLGDTHRTGQRKLGYVVLIERADVLVVGLFRLALRLGDGKIVRDASVEALLRLAKGLVREIYIRVSRFDQFCCGLDVEQVV